MVDDTTNQTRYRKRRRVQETYSKGHAGWYPLGVPKIPPRSIRFKSCHSPKYDGESEHEHATLLRKFSITYEKSDLENLFRYAAYAKVAPGLTKHMP